MVPEGKLDWNCMKDREINGVNNVWSTAQRLKKIYRFDVSVVFELSHRSVGYGK